MTDLNRVILFLGLTTMGALHDYFLLKEELHWYDNQDSWFEFIELFIQ